MVRPFSLLIAAFALAASGIAHGQDTLSPQRGSVELSSANASLELGRDFAFYGPEDTRRIVVDIWENPPTEADGVLGLVMPAGSSPRDRSWGALVTWEPVGWVSADDARSADYDALMREMQSEARDRNAQGRGDGFAAVKVVGWAQRPAYDSVAHAVSWARTLRFADAEDDPDTLHYDVRILGRYGVLSLNIVGDETQLPEIREAARELKSRVQFAPGARYEDFDRESDDVAGYGIAGLVASGAGLAVAKNLGVFAVLAKLAQPIGAALLVLALALATPFRRIFRKAGKAGKPATR